MEKEINALYDVSNMSSGQDGEVPLINLVDWGKARKSSKCGNSFACVEVAPGEGGVVGFQDEARTRLAFDAGVVATFMAAVKAGEFNISPQ